MPTTFIKNDTDGNTLSILRHFHVTYFISLLCGSVRRVHLQFKLAFSFICFLSDYILTTATGC